MKVLLQRVRRASVNVNDETVGQINHGLLLFVGIEKTDNLENLHKMAHKVISYRVFSDCEGKMNLNVQQVSGELLVVSQFTLAADTKKGMRPGFSSAAAGDTAQKLFNDFVLNLKEKIECVQTGQFAADMQVELINDGPVTFLLEN